MIEELKSKKYTAENGPIIMTKERFLEIEELLKKREQRIIDTQNQINPKSS